MRHLNMLLRCLESIGVFVLAIGLPFMICLAITRHSTHPLWFSVCITLVSFAAFIIAIAVYRSSHKEAVNVYYGKKVLCRAGIWIVVIGLFGSLAYLLGRSWAIVPFVVLVMAHLFLTIQLSRLCLSMIWRKDKVVVC